MISDVEPEDEGHDGDEPEDDRTEVLVITVWRIGREPGRPRARLRRAGEQTGWRTTTLGVTEDPKELVRLVDSWVRDLFRD